ncbi:MAG: YqaA family protein [Desulfocurvibacter africanus]
MLAVPYSAMFVTAFLAATIFPAQSEILLVTLLLSGKHDILMLLAVATAGNTLGSMVNWVLGRFFSEYRDRRWFPLKPKLFDRAVGWYQRYGIWSLLLSWAPFVGDPLTVVAGVLKTNLWRFTAIVLLAKAGRYLFVTAATLGWMGRS